MERSSPVQPPMACARVVCQSTPQVQALPHAVRSIDLFVGPSPRWTIERAAAERRLRLMSRLLERESPRVSKEHRRERRLQGIEKAASIGSVEVLEWWTYTYLPEPCTISNATVRAAAVNGHLAALQWLLQRWNGPENGSRLFLKCQSPEIAYWLHGQDVAIRLSVDLDAVARAGDLAFMQWIGKHQRDLAQVTGTSVLLSIASDRGDLAMTQWLLVNWMKSDPLAEANLSTSLPQGWHPVSRNQAVVSYTVTEFPMPELHNSHLQLIRWLSSDYKWEDASLRRRWIQKAMVHAAALGDIELVEMLEDGDLVFSSLEDRFQAPLWLATYHGRLAMVQWLLERGGRLDGKIMDAAAASGHVHILQWLLENGDSSICHNEAVYAAVCADQRLVVDWLLENRSAWTSAEGAMDLAAARGDLGLLQLLHLNDVGGCTQRAMYDAAQNGHLAVVRWLFANQSEGCTSGALQVSVARGHVAVAQFLHEHYAHSITSGMVEEAVSKGHLKMVRWLDAKRLIEWSPSLMQLARFAGKAELLALIDR